MGAGGAGWPAGGAGPESRPLWHPSTASRGPSTREGGAAPDRRTTKPSAPPTRRQHATAHHSLLITRPLTCGTDFWHPTGSGPLPGVPLFVLTHHVPDTVSAGDPPYAFVTDGIERAVEQAGPPPRARMWPSWGRRSCARASRRSARCARHQPGAGGAGARRPPAGRPGARERPARPSPSHRRPGRHAPDLPKPEVTRSRHAHRARSAAVLGDESGACH